MLHVGFARIAFRDFVLRQVRLVEDEFQVAVVGDTAGVRHGAGEFGKGRCDFFSRFDVELIGIEFHSVRVAEGLAGLEAEHQFVRMGVFFFEVVAVVGACHRDIEFLVDFNQAGIGDALVVEPVSLHFEVEMLFPEDFLEFTGHGHGAVHIFLADKIGNLAAETA